MSSDVAHLPGQCYRLSQVIARDPRLTLLPSPNSFLHDRRRCVGQSLLQGVEQSTRAANCFRNPISSQSYADQRAESRPLPGVSEWKLPPRRQGRLAVLLCL
jgi:hypothetical protein